MAAEKDEIIPVGPGADEDVREESEERAEDLAEGGEPEDQEEEERLGQAEEGEEDEREVIRRRRRAEKARKKENRNRDRLELNFLRQRNEQLERRQSELDSRVANGEMVLIDNKIAELDSQIREAERIKAMAIDKSDGKSAAEADRIANDLRAGLYTLQNVKNQRTLAAQTVRTMPSVDPAIQARAREWAERHSWYDTNLRNADSRVAKAVEDQLWNEGNFDARNEDYWDELDERLRKYMPHRFGNGQRNTREEEGDEGEREERRSRGPQVRVGGRERPLRKNEVYIDADRKEALIKAGVWDDPVLRDKFLKQYQKYDRENRRH
jgi:actin-related protein